MRKIDLSNCLTLTCFYDIIFVRKVKRGVNYDETN